MQTIEKTVETDAYIDAVMALTPDYMVLVIIVLAIVGGFLGTMLGKIVLKKHLKKQELPKKSNATCLKKCVAFLYKRLGT